MYLHLQRSLVLLCAYAVSVGVVPVALSEPMPPFAGSYELTQIVDEGAQVSFTVKFTLLNSTNADIKGGILVIKDSGPNALLIGKVATIKLLPHLGQTDVSESLRVSAAEYTRWQHGHLPRFDFLLPSADGAMDVAVQARPIAQPVQKIN